MNRTNWILVRGTLARRRSYERGEMQRRVAEHTLRDVSYRQGFIWALDSAAEILNEDQDLASVMTKFQTLLNDAKEGLDAAIIHASYGAISLTAGELAGWTTAFEFVKDAIQTLDEVLAEEAANDDRIG